MADQSLLSRRLLVAGLIGALLISGCTRTARHRIARFQPAGGAEETTLAVPAAGVWKVKVRGRGEKEYHGIDGTERFLQAGDVVGFRTGDDGVVHAVANHDEIPLALTDEHRRVAWHANIEKRTEVGLAMGEAMQVSGEVATIVGIAALALWAWLESSNDDDDGRHRARFNNR